MPFCPNCGEELPAGARFCKRCGASINNTGYSQPPQYNEPPRGYYQEPQRGYYQEPPRQEAPERKSIFSKPQQQQKKKFSLKSVFTTALITILSGVLIGFCGTMSGGLSGSVKKSKDTAATEQNISGMTDEEMALNGIAGSPDGALMGSESLKRYMAAANIDTSEIEDFLEDLDDLSDEELEAHEENLFKGDMKRWRKSYNGKWKSVGLWPMKFEDLQSLSNAEVAALIDQNMKLTDQVEFTFQNKRHGKSTLSILFDGTEYSGEHNVGACGNMTIDTPDGGKVWMWMYSPTDGVLFSYLYTLDENDEEIAYGLKFNRAK